MDLQLFSLFVVGASVSAPDGTGWQWCCVCPRSKALMLRDKIRPWHSCVWHACVSKLALVPGKNNSISGAKTAFEPCSHDPKPSSPREDRKTIIAARRRQQNRKTDTYYILSCHRRRLKQTESKTAIMYRTFEKKKDAVDPRYPSLSLPTTGSHNFHCVKTYIHHQDHIDFWQQWFSLHLSSVDWLSSWQLSYQPVIRPTRLH